jgi:hypothetical protein
LTLNQLTFYQNSNIIHKNELQDRPKNGNIVPFIQGKGSICTPNLKAVFSGTGIDGVQPMSTAGTKKIVPSETFMETKARVMLGYCHFFQELGKYNNIGSFGYIIKKGQLFVWKYNGRINYNSPVSSGKWYYEVIMRKWLLIVI